MKINIPSKYKKIWERAEPLLKKCRPGDLIHAKQTAELVYNFIKTHKKGDMDILIPVAIFHDIGHAAILPEHFEKISGLKKLPNSKLVHMLTGAKIAKEILTKIKYPKSKTKEIIEIISIHDMEEPKWFDTKNKKIFRDLDHLDRFSKKRFKTILNLTNWTPKQLIEYLKKKEIPFFFNREIKEIAEEMLKEREKEYKLLS
ncbi:HD domain-containing protein [bacterium]|nr:HD domain-containing protein [bacterium]